MYSGMWCWRWARAGGREGAWAQLGLLSGMVCMGSVAGAVAWGAGMQLNALYYEDHQFTIRGRSVLEGAHHHLLPPPLTTCHNPQPSPPRQRAHAARRFYFTPSLPFAAFCPGLRRLRPRTHTCVRHARLMTTSHRESGGSKHTACSGTRERQGRCCSCRLLLTSLRCCNEGALHQTTDSNTCNARNVTVVQRHKGMCSAVWDE